MRRAEILLLVLLLPACSAAPGDAEGRLIRISHFDCVTEDGAKGISLWAAGGPGGAAWNVEKLRCAVELQTTCSQGTADVELRIGGALSGSKQLKIERAGQQQVTFDVAADQWQQHLDQATALTQRLPYQTATFSASAIASCQAPETLGPSTGPRLEFADDRHFTAGFASGE